MLKTLKLPIILKYSLFFLLLFSIPVAYLTYEPQILNWFTRTTNPPQNVAVTNVSPTSFTISWYTDRADVGYVAVLPKDHSDITKLKEFDKNHTYTLYKDDRAVLESKAISELEPYDVILPENYNDRMVNFSNLTSSNLLANDPEFFTHHITVAGLKPETEYEVVIFNGSVFYPVDISTIKTRYALNYAEMMNSKSEEKKPQSLFDKLAKKEKQSPAFTVKTIAETDILTTPVALYGVMQWNLVDSDLPPVLQETEYVDVRDGIVYLYDEESDFYFSAPVQTESYWSIDIDSRQIAGEMLNIYGQVRNLTPTFVEKTEYVDLLGKRYDIKVDIELEDSQKAVGNWNSNYTFASNQEPTMLPDLRENSSWILDTLVGDVSASSVNCRQDLPDQTVSGAKGKEEYGKLMDMWTGNRGRNHARECYNDVVCRSNAAGIHPAWSLTIWANESGASNYTLSSAKVADFGIIYKPREDFNAQIETFLQYTYVKSCPELDFWTSWATKYLTGTCDPEKLDPVGGFNGRTYLKSIQDKWKLVSSEGFPETPKITPKTTGCSTGGGTKPPDDGGFWPGVIYQNLQRDYRIVNGYRLLGSMAMVMSLTLR
jgi:hypothetical protein